MSIYNSPYRLRPINSAAARGIAPGDLGELEVMRQVESCLVERRHSGCDGGAPKRMVKRKEEKRNMSLAGRYRANYKKLIALSFRMKDEGHKKREGKKK